MYKKDVIDHFGTQRAVAKALGITRVLLLRRRRVDLVRQPQAINWLRSRRLSVSLGYQTR